MSITALFAPILAIIKPLLPLGRTQVHSAAQAAFTIPKRDRDRLHTGLNEEDRAEAERLAKVMADACADYAVFVASRGAIDADD